MTTTQEPLSATPNEDGSNNIDEVHYIYYLLDLSVFF